MDWQRAQRISRETEANYERLPEILAAEQVIARMPPKALAALRRQVQRQPGDGYLRLWHGLTLAQARQHRHACQEFTAAIGLGCGHWRVAWYLAESAQAAGDVAQVDAACAAILAGVPEFFYAAELPKHVRGFYARYGQDQFIEAFFRQHPPRHKVFVEVGAFDGVHYSNVRRLHERDGWGGVCIEPVQRNFAKLAASYRGKSVRCVRAAAGDGPGEADIWANAYPHLPDWGSEWATFTPPGNGLTGLVAGDPTAPRWTTERVAVRTLTAMLDEQGVTGFDLLSVGTEGYDLRVLQGLDWARWHPALVVVAYGPEREAIRAFLAAQGYGVAADDGMGWFMADASLLAQAVAPVPDTAITVRRDDPSLRERLRPNILARIPPENVLKRVRPLELLTPQRFDVLAPYLYAKHRALGVDSDWAARLYADHMQAFNGCREPDGSGKVGLDAFRQAFHQTLDAMQRDGFDSSRSLIPVGRGHILMDGAHRLAAALVYDKDVTALFCDVPTFAYDYRFLRDHHAFVPTGLSGKWLDAMALEYCRLNPRTYIVTVFPAAQGRDDEVRAILQAAGQIVYEKRIALTGQGSLHLMRQMYAGEPWLGDGRNGYQGAQVKADLCYRQPGPTRVYVLEADTLAQVKAAKQQIRDLFQIENHSVHINDTHAETVRLAQMLLNDHSIHFLNHARLEHDDGFAELLQTYKAWLRRTGRDPEHFCLDGGAVLAVYGLRPTRDLDVLHFGTDELATGHPLIAGHDAIGRDDIIFNPENHFWFDGIKFASLDVVRIMKADRAEAKDVQDVARIDAVLRRTPSIQSPTAPPSNGVVVNIVYAHTDVPGHAVHKGDATVVWSRAPLAGCSLYAYVDAFSYRGRQPGRNVLLLNEPVIVLPGQYGQQVWREFDDVLTWVEGLPSQVAHARHAVLPAYDIPKSADYTKVADLHYARPWTEKRNAIVMVNGNKVSGVPGELYSKRVEAARWFYDHSDIPFDVYGHPPFQLPNYRGQLTPYAQKYVTMAQYRYALAFENVYHPAWSRGYFTEKMMDALVCETVPIYLGCYNVEDYIPDGCYIDLRRFKGYAELDRFLHGITDAQYAAYQEAIRAWVRAGNLERFSMHRRYDELVMLADPSPVAATRAQGEWQPGPAPIHAGRAWQTAAGREVWNWQGLATQAPPDLMASLLALLVDDVPDNPTYPSLWPQVRRDFLARHPDWQPMVRDFAQKRQPPAPANGAAPTTGKAGLTSIIILNYNGGAHVRQCIESVRACTDVPYELILVDNASTDGSRDYLRTLSDVTLVENPVNLGCPPARTQALALAQGDAVVFLDNDTVVTPGWLSTLRRHAQQNPRIGLLGPRSNFVSGSQQVAAAPYRDLAGLQQFAAEWAAQHRGQRTPVARLVGFCLFVQREVIDRIGAPDPQFGKFGFEDDDYTLRALVAGFQPTVAHDVFVHHTGGPQSRGNAEYNEHLQAAWATFKRKWGLPDGLAYGAAFDISTILAQPFDPARHAVPIPPRTAVEPLLYHPTQVDIIEALAEAQAALEQGNTDTALQAFSRAAERRPESAEAHGGRGLALMQLGRVAEAVVALRRAAELAPASAEAQNRLGVALYRMGDLTGAEAAFQTARRAAPDDVDALLNLIDLYRAQERYVEATDYVKRAVALAPNHPDVLIAFGSIGLLLGQPDAARGALANLKRVAPEHPAVPVLERALA